MNVIQPKCVACHNASMASAGVDLSSYAKVIATSVKAGNPGASSLYTSISSGRMPPGGGVSAADLQSISDWISAGAPNN